MPAYRPIEERFWEKVKKTKGCWLWQASTQQGYGIVSYKGRCRFAHRVSWELEHGSPPRGFVLHRCDIPACVRPSHLFIGTQTDNMRDCYEKERHMRGEMSGNAKLTEKTVRQMRKEAPFTTYIALAAKYGVSESVARRAAKGQTWKHVK